MRALILLTLPLLTLPACKPAGAGSQLQSLDNATRPNGGVETINLCGIDYTGKEPLGRAAAAAAQRVEADTLSLRLAAVGALATVPDALLAPFVAAKGRIRILSGARELCGSTSFSAGERDLLPADARDQGARSCWRKVSAAAAPELVIDADAALVRHSLLRLVAYYYAQHFVAGVLDERAPAPFNGKAWKDAARGFAAERERLAAALLQDLEDVRAPGRARLEAFAERDADAFANMAFAEAIDSYYCSTASNAVFENRFARTWAVFTDRSSRHAPVAQFGAR